MANKFEENPVNKEIIHRAFLCRFFSDYPCQSLVEKHQEFAGKRLMFFLKRLTEFKKLFEGFYVRFGLFFTCLPVDGIQSLYDSICK